MQEELKSLHKLLGITFIFVTHDQNEALSMADRVALFNEGRLIQVGTPQEIYHRPPSPIESIRPENLSQLHWLHGHLTGLI